MTSVAASFNSCVFYEATHILGEYETCMWSLSHALSLVRQTLFEIFRWLPFDTVSPDPIGRELEA